MYAMFATRGVRRLGALIIGCGASVERRKRDPAAPVAKIKVFSPHLPPTFLASLLQFGHQPPSVRPSSH